MTLVCDGFFCENKNLKNRIINNKLFPTYTKILIIKS